MIELLLEAERTLAVGLLDRADALYRRVLEQDPHNAIAHVGLARVAVERGEESEAYRLASRAVELDPENPAAVAMVVRLREVLAGRGRTVELPPQLRGVPVQEAASGGAARKWPGPVRRLFGRARRPTLGP